jgi:membrane protease YdiL (CAAX protease family)
MTAPGRPQRPGADRLVGRYALGVATVVLAVLSPYFVPAILPATHAVYGSLAGVVLIVYGIPIVALSVLVGAGPLRGWAASPRRAPMIGLGWFGAMALLGLGIALALSVVYLAFDPGALKLLQKPNPALQGAAADPWFFVGFSFVVGALEETIFRGWIFGFWAGRSASWLTPAILSSALFAALHLYYGTTYGVAAPLIFPSLFLVGFAFAATYHATGGNLVVPAVLHGAYDATGYLTLVSLGAGAALRGLLLVGSALVGLVYYLHSLELRGKELPPPAWGT